MKLLTDDWRADDAARDRIRRDLDTSFLVEAAAGTGKTTLLIERLVAVLRSGGTTVDRIVAVTFTRKASGELKLRLRQQLDRDRGDLRRRIATAADDPTVDAVSDLVAQLQRVDDAVERLEEARIGTIHSFCAEILRERPVEAGVDPGFVELADDEGPALFARAFDRWIQEQLEVMSPGIRRALSVLALQKWYGDQGPIDRLRGAAQQLADWRDFPAAWSRTPFDRESTIDALVAHVRRLAGYARRAGSSRDPLRSTLEPMVLLDDWIRRGTSFEHGASERDYDALEARLLELYTEMNKWHRRKKGRGKFAEALPREQVVGERDALVATLREFREAAGADLAALLHSELQGALDAYDALKRREGRLDFADLILRARDLLRDDETVRGELQERFTHLFVDEFQDTDPLQAEVLLLLAGADPAVDDWRRVTPSPGKLFLVGDPKQSIYRFRRADIQLYQEIGARLAAVGVEQLELSRSFRSVAAIQRLVNDAFASEMDGDVRAGRPRYIPLAECRTTPRERPSLVVLPVPEPFNYRGYVTNREVQKSLPGAVGAWCHWLLEESGWQVQDPETKEHRPVESSDVCVLFRRFLSWGDDVTRDYTRALEARGIDHLLLGQRTFHQREEVETVRAALTAIEWPDDQLAVFATLRGSLLAFPDDQLLRLRSAIGGFTPARWRHHLARVEAGEERELPADLGEVGEALLLIDDLHRRRNRRAVVETVQELLERTRAHAGFAMRPAGHQVLANLDRVCDLARSYEVAGGHSFRGFVERLEEQAAKPSSSDAAVIEEGAEGVRLMTVHSAKGLEFPVVVLADPTCNMAHREPDRTVDVERGLCAMKLLGMTPLELRHATELEHERDLAEATRIAYVAATRARDLLVIPAVGDAPIDGSWLEPLSKAIYPPTESRRRSSPAPGCPEFGDSSVLRRPNEMPDQPDGSVRPGLHRFAEGAYDVVWWDPASLTLEAPTSRGLWREELLAPRPGDGEVASEPSDPSFEEYRLWLERQGEARENGARPTSRTVAVTQIEEDPPGGLREFETVGEPSGSRPSGLRFGDLVHSVLQLVPLTAGAGDEGGEGDDIDGAVRRLALLQGRTLGASEEEVEAAVAAVGEALRGAGMRRLASADELLREVPFVLRLDDGRQLEGVFDLLARSGEQWTVVDFKTDVALEGREEHYRRQLSWYLFALEQLTGSSPRGLLQRV